MIVLEFKVDEAELTRDLSESPNSANPAALEETYFVMPVSFVVGATNMLAFPGANETWYPQPILGFAVHMAGAVLQLKHGESSTCHVADGGRLEFERSGWTMRVSSTLLPENAEIVPATEMIGAVRKFRHHVRDLLLQREPAMKNHPWWDEWFPE
ncbi:MAG: hypothetical protein IT182_00255 [Acidobacteria bacterium]|nr:hypothetical protein [Acidobacteriota bacterium]